VKRKNARQHFAREMLACILSFEGNIFSWQ